MGFTTAHLVNTMPISSSYCIYYLKYPPTLFICDTPCGLAILFGVIMQVALKSHNLTDNHASIVFKFYLQFTMKWLSKIDLTQWYEMLCHFFPSLINIFQERRCSCTQVQYLIGVQYAYLFCTRRLICLTLFRLNLDQICLGCNVPNWSAPGVPTSHFRGTEIYCWRQVSCKKLSP